jgi:hypothetical protein
MTVQLVLKEALSRMKVQLPASNADVELPIMVTGQNVSASVHSEPGWSQATSASANPDTSIQQLLKQTRHLLSASTANLC